MSHMMETQIKNNVKWNMIHNVMKRINNVIPLDEIIKRMSYLGWTQDETEEIVEEMAAADIIEIRYGRVNDYIIL